MAIILNTAMSFNNVNPCFFKVGPTKMECIVLSRCKLLLNYHSLHRSGAS